MHVVRKFDLVSSVYVSNTSIKRSKSTGLVISSRPLRNCYNFQLEIVVFDGTSGINEIIILAQFLTLLTLFRKKQAFELKRPRSKLLINSFIRFV